MLPNTLSTGARAGAIKGIASLLPVRQFRLVLVRSVHDPVLDVIGFERGSPFFVLVSLVGVDRRLVATDQRLGYTAFVHMRRCQRHPTDDGEVLVDANVQAIAEIAFAALAGEGRSRLFGQRRLRSGFRRRTT